MIVQSESKTYTLDQYRALEEKAEFRSEYHDGDIISLLSKSVKTLIFPSLKWRKFVKLSQSDKREL